MGTHRYTGPVFDADNHFYETQDALTRYLPSRYSSAIKFVQVDGRTKIAINGLISDYIPNPTFDVVARPGTHLAFFKGDNPDGKTLREMTGDPMRSVEAFRSPEPRLELLDDLGIDASLMFPTLASLVEERMRHDPELTHAVIHALNEWMHETWKFDYKSRIYATPIVTLPIVERAIQELDWVLERGAKAILIRPAPVPGYRGSRSFGLPEFDPFWARVQDSGILVCLHGSDTGYSKYLDTWEGDSEYLPFKPNPFRDAALGKRPIEDAVTALICHGAAARFPNVRFALVENGAMWIPHLMEQLDLTYRRMPKEFAEHPRDTFQRNFWINPFGEDDIHELLKHVPPERVLFGSDYPHPEGLAEPVKFADSLSDLPAQDLEGIMGGNLAGLMGEKTHEGGMTMAPMAEVRRFLHSNYNCRDLDGLERWYTELFSLKPVMRSVSTDTDAWAFGVHQPTHTDTIFLYDHRGARRSTSLKLVGWTNPPIVGYPYQDPWEHGIQAVGYTVPDLHEVVRKAESLGGRLVRQVANAALLRDPEGVWVELYESQAGEPEAHHMRLVVKDLAQTMDWYANIGFAVSSDAIAVPGAELWPTDDQHSLSAETAMVGTDDPTYSLIFTTWSGPPPTGPSYGAHFHNGVYRFAVAVDDVQVAYERLRDGGVATYPPYTFQLPGTKIVDGLTILFIRDPQGVMVELVQRPRSIFR